MNPELNTPYINLELLSKQNSKCFIAFMMHIQNGYSLTDEYINILNNMWLMDYNIISEEVLEVINKHGNELLKNVK